MTSISDNRRYHQHYDNEKYLAIREQVEAQVNQEGSLIIMNLLIDTCIDTSRGLVTDKIYELAKACFNLTLVSVHQIADYITLFETVGSGGVGADIYLIVQCYQRLQSNQLALHEAVAISSNIHGVRGQMLHNLLRASNHLVEASLALMKASHARYVGSKLEDSIQQLTYGLQIGLADTENDSSYDFSAHQFPQAEAKEEN